MQIPPFNWVAFWLKLRGLFQSRKFWALVAALATTGVTYFAGEINAGQALLAVISALSAYSLATGIEDSGMMNKLHG